MTEISERLSPWSCLCSNREPCVYQFREQSLSDTGGAFVDNRKLEIYQLCTNIQGLKQRKILQELQVQSMTIIVAFQNSLERISADNYEIVLRANKRPAGEYSPRVDSIKPYVFEHKVIQFLWKNSNRNHVCRKQSGA